MSREMMRRMFGFGASAAAAVCLTPTQSMGGGQTSVDCGTTTTVWVEWSQVGNPDPVQDFRVDCTDAVNPDVEFLKGDGGWVLWAVQYGTQDPGSLGAISIDWTSGPDDFEVTIANGANPGAANVKSMVLDDTGWTGYSSITGGQIALDQIGPITVKADGGGNGGALALVIGRYKTGDLNAATVASVDIGDAMTGSITATTITSLHVAAIVVGHITADTVTSLDIDGGVTGDITVDTVTSLDIDGGVTGDITVYRVDTLLDVGGDVGGAVSVGTVAGASPSGVASPRP